MSNKYVKIIFWIFLLTLVGIIIFNYYYPLLLALLVFVLGYLHFANLPK